MLQTSGTSISAILLTSLAVGAICAYASYGSAEPFVLWLFGWDHGDIRLGAWTADQLASFDARFALACAFAGAATAACVLLFNPSALSLAAFFLHVLLFLMVGLLSFASAAAFYRSECSQLVMMGPRSFRRPHVVISPDNIPALRVPLIAGIFTITVAALMRAAADRLGRRHRPHRNQDKELQQ